MKEAISTQYREELARVHGKKRLRPTGRYAVVIGSDRAGNIGSEIADRLAGDMRFSRIAEPGMDQIDVRFPNDLRDFFALTDERPDTLVLSHGRMRLDWFEDCPREDIEDIVQTNVTGTIYALQEFVRATIATSYRKRVVVIGSMAYRNVLNGSAVYCASKAAVAHLVRCLGWELTPKGYDIVAVHPSNTKDAPMSEETIQGLMRYRNLSREDAESYWGSVNLLPDWLTGGDIAEFAHWFATDAAASFLSGTQIDLAGGQR